MARNAKQIPAAGGNSKMEAPQLDPGAYPARVVQVIFLGTQEQRPYNGQQKPPVDEVRITYELSTEFMTDEDGNIIEDKPRWFSETIPFYSLAADLAKSTKRYKAIDPKDECDGDFSKLLGKACQVFLAVNAGKGKHVGKTFTNIGDVTAAINVPGYDQPQLKNDPFYFDPQDEECSVEDFNSLPEWLQETIQKALDYTGSPLARKLGGSTTSAPEVAENGTEDVTEEDVY